MEYPFNVETVDFSGIGSRDDWKARDRGMNEFKRQYPQPEPPAKLAPIEAGEAQIVHHNKVGGLWLELAEPDGHHDPRPPQAEMMLVIGEEATAIKLTLKQVIALAAEVQRVAAEMDITQHRFEAWRAAQGEYEDEHKRWADARDAAGAAADSAWRGRPEKGKVKSKAKTKEDGDAEA